MKKMFSVLFVLLVLFTILVDQPAADIKKGDFAKVPEWTWITIMNPDGIKDGSNSNPASQFFNFGDSAGIESVGFVIVLGFHKDQVLVEYERHGTPSGTQCPHGAIFFLEKKVFAEWKAGKLAKIQNEENALKELVRKILKDK